MDNTGRCQGTHYSDNFGQWNDVIVQGYVTITLTQHQATIDTGKDTIHLQGQLTCKPSKESCIDSNNGEYYWTYGMKDTCNPSKYSVLFEGVANQSRELTSDSPSTTEVITVIDQETSFSLQLTGATTVCNAPAYKTEHPKLVIIIQGG